ARTASGRLRIRGGSLRCGRSGPSARDPRSCRGPIPCHDRHAWLCDVRRRRASDRSAALLVAPLVLFGRAGAQVILPTAFWSTVWMALSGDRYDDLTLPS